MPAEPTQVRKAFGFGRVASLSFPIPRRALSLCSIPQALVVLCIYHSVQEMGIVKLRCSF